jgi:hypothetical protein
MINKDEYVTQIDDLKNRKKETWWMVWKYKNWRMAKMKDGQKLRN